MLDLVPHRRWTAFWPPIRAMARYTFLLQAPEGAQRRLLERYCPKAYSPMAYSSGGYLKGTGV